MSMCDAGAAHSTQIVASRLPLHDNHEPSVVGHMIFVCVVISVLSFLRGAGWGEIVLIGVCVLIAMVALTLHDWNRFQKRLTRRPTPMPQLSSRAESPPQAATIEVDQRFAEVIHELERSRAISPFRDSTNWTWLALLEALRSHGLPRPRTVVDEAAVSQLSRVPLPTHMLEPETILDSGDSPRGGIIGGSVAAVVAAIVLLVFGQWVLSLVVLGIAAIWVYQLPEVRDATRLFHLKQSETIVGLGALVGDERRWTVHDAVMVVQCGRDIGPLNVMIVGEAGKLELSFTDEADPDFVKLWQRWNHPSPQPHLLSE